MKFLATLLLSALTLLPIRPNPTYTADSIKRSITIIGNDEWECTAFSSAIHKLITAAHCVSGDVGDQNEKTEHGSVLTVRYVDKKHDIAVVETTEMLPLLELGKEPKVGDQATYFGYGMGGNGSFFYVIPTSIMNLHDTPLKDWHHMMAFSTNSINGMSGGPIIDQEGKVISTVIGGANDNSPIYIVGAGTTYDVVKTAFSK